MRRLKLHIVALSAVLSMFGFTATLAGATTSGTGSVHVYQLHDTGSDKPVVTPFSTTKCGGDVCIDISGTGDFVNFINVYNRYGVTQPPGEIVEIVVNGSTNWPGGVFVIGYNSYGIHVVYNANFPSYAQVCGYMEYLIGYPCAQIIP